MHIHLQLVINSYSQEIQLLDLELVANTFHNQYQNNNDDNDDDYNFI